MRSTSSWIRQRSKPCGRMQTARRSGRGSPTWKPGESSLLKNSTPVSKQGFVGRSQHDLRGRHERASGSRDGGVRSVVGAGAICRAVRTVVHRYSSCDYEGGRAAGSIPESGGRWCVSASAPVLSPAAETLLKTAGSKARSRRSFSLPRLRNQLKHLPDLTQRAFLGCEVRFEVFKTTQCLPVVEPFTARPADEHLHWRKHYVGANGDSLLYAGLVNMNSVAKRAFHFLRSRELLHSRGSGS